MPRLPFRWSPPALALLLLCASGCFYSREMAHTRREIERRNPGLALRRRVVLGLGPATLGAAGRLVSLSRDDEARTVRAYLRDVRRLKLGVYDVRGLGGGGDLPLRYTPEGGRRPWETAVKVRDEGEAVWVLYRERRGAVRELMVVALSDEELVVAKLEGRLERLLERAIAEQDSLLGHMPF